MYEVASRRRGKSNPAKLFSIMEKSFFIIYLLLMLGNVYIFHRDYSNFSLQIKLSYVLILSIFVTILVSFGFVLFTMIMDCRRRAKISSSVKAMSFRKSIVSKHGIVNQPSREQIVRNIKHRLNSANSDASPE